ncbi:MAG: type II secretion system F family protein [Methanomicrobiales archaeon]|nr:type II secretion system F family protein [Methanomicrobiales archaeon]
MNSYQRFCFNLLGKQIKLRREQYTELRNNLLSARIKTPFEAYLSTAIITAVIVGLVMAVIIGMITFFLQVPTMIKYGGTLPGFLEDVFSNPTNQMIFGTAFAVIVSLFIFGGITYIIFLFYPNVVAGERRRNIDATLPYAINYITAMSTAGITPAEIFRLLAESTIYGESAVEARYVSREIDIFGKDLIDSLRITSTITPSLRMKEFLQGAMASISSGGNLTDYFRTKANQYALENRQQQKIFLETLGLIAESYVTALVAGTLFLIILQSIMSMLSGQKDPIFLYVIIYGIIPFGSVMFVILISSMTPEV